MLMLLLLREKIVLQLFNFTGNELYFEKVPELAGKTFKEAIMSFSNAVVVGLQTSGQVKLNPPMDTIIGKDDEIVLLELDDGAYNYHPAKTVEEAKICNNASVSAIANNHLIVLGSNEKLPTILTEYSKYVESGTHVVIVDDDLDEAKLGTYDNLNITVCTKQVTRELLCEFINKDANNILLLNDDNRKRKDSHTKQSKEMRIVGF